MASTVYITMAGIKRKHPFSSSTNVSLLPSCYRWDEWVSESRILKLNEAGLEKQKSLQLENQSE